MNSRGSPHKRAISDPGRSLFDILGLSRSASPDEIDKAYRKLLIEYGPDHNNGESKDIGRYMLIKEAYGILSDPMKRYYYLKYGPVGIEIGEELGYEYLDWFHDNMGCISLMVCCALLPMGLCALATCCFCFCCCCCCGRCKGNLAKLNS